MSCFMTAACVKFFRISKLTRAPRRCGAIGTRGTHEMRRAAAWPLLAALALGGGPGTTSVHTSAAGETDIDDADALALGLTLMWTTPILRTQAVDGASTAGAALLEELYTTARSEHDAFFARDNSDGAALRRGMSPNDRFFEAQSDADERARAGDASAPFAAFRSGAFARLRASLRSAVDQYVRAAAGPDAADALGPDTELFMWAAVHSVHDRTGHAPHIHEHAAVSGVFYVAAPEGSGDITFDDPRGLRPPFARNRLSHSPRPGELLLFPPWVGHAVAPSACTANASAPRVSLPFNVFVGGRGARHGHAPVGGGRTADWELLADASVTL